MKKEIINEALKITKNWNRDNQTETFNFNPLEIFFKVGENKLTELIAFFIKGENYYGLNEKYGQAFINLTIDETTEDEWIISKVETEHKLPSGRRIDLYVELKKLGTKELKIVAIENKIWAYDQKDQLRDYYDYLNVANKPNFLLFYLTPYGAKPNTGDKDMDENIKVLTHDEWTLNLLNKWRDISLAQKIVLFINWIIEFIEMEINEYKENALTNKIMKILKDANSALNQDKVLAAVEIKIALEAALPEIINSYYQGIREKLRPSKWILENSSKDSILIDAIVRNPNLPEFEIHIETDPELFFGVFIKNDEKRNSFKEYCEAKSLHLKYSDLYIFLQPNQPINSNWSSDSNQIRWLMGQEGINDTIQILNELMDIISNFNS